jgi:hypothetical protein
MSKLISAFFYSTCLSILISLPVSAAAVSWNDYEGIESSSLDYHQTIKNANQTISTSQIQTAVDREMLTKSLRDDIMASKPALASTTTNFSVPSNGAGDDPGDGFH